MKILLISLILTGCATPFLLKRTEIKRYQCVQSLIARGVEAEKAYKICTNLFTADMIGGKYR